MSKRTQKSEVVEQKPVDSSVNAEIEAANEQALKDAAAAQEKPADDTPPADACEVWGSADANSKICKKCPVLDACLAKTNAGKKSKKSASTGEKKPRAERVAGNGLFSLFGRCKANSQAGIIEAALVEPHTIAELEAITGCTTSRIKSHIGRLVANHSGRCTKVLSEGGKIHFTVNEA